MQGLATDSLCSLTNPQPYQRDGAEPPLAAASMANTEYCFMKLNMGVTAASGWLSERLCKKSSVIQKYVQIGY
jgi:hypothetical protein